MSPTQTVTRGTTLFITILIAALVAMVTAGITAYFSQHVFNGKIDFTTPYQAVQLNNGAAYFCKVEALGTPFPILKEVYYVQSRTNPETKQVANVLMKRGAEWWQPDRMIVNANDIVFIEPVNPSSRVAQLIAEEKLKH